MAERHQKSLPNRIAEVKPETQEEDVELRDISDDSQGGDEAESLVVMH